MLIVENLQIQTPERVLIIADCNFTLESGEILAMLGPSGSGKTSILRSIAGLMPILSGSIILDNDTLSNSKHFIMPARRNISMVFQDYALFPHLTVRQNIAFGLAKLSRVQCQQRIIELLDLIELPDISNKYPHQLSSGEQQRVALARALAPKPKLLLLDEPFSNLDDTHKDHLIPQMRTILTQENMTSIFVTHDQKEAAVLSDKVSYIADKGLIKAINTKLSFSGSEAS